MVTSPLSKLRKVARTIMNVRSFHLARGVRMLSCDCEGAMLQVGILSLSLYLFLLALSNLR